MSTGIEKKPSIDAQAPQTFLQVEAGIYRYMDKKGRITYHERPSVSVTRTYRSLGYNFTPQHNITKGALAKRLRSIRKKLKRKLTSHGMRAFYVLIRRSQGASDEQIAVEIGHTSNGACIKTTYGGVPDEWRTGKGPIRHLHSQLVQSRSVLVGRWALVDKYQFVRVKTQGCGFGNQHVLQFWFYFLVPRQNP